MIHFLAPLVAALATTAVGVSLMGLPALVASGLPVAVVTLAFGVAIEAVWFPSQFVGTSGKDLTGPMLFGLDLRARVGSTSLAMQFGLLVLVVLVGVAGWCVGQMRTEIAGVGDVGRATSSAQRPAPAMTWCG